MFVFNDLAKRKGLVKPTGTETVGTLMSTVLAQKLKAFCERVSLTQPQAIRTLIFNFVSADENTDRKTSFGRSARIQQRNFDNFDGAIVRVDAVLSTSQAKRLDRFCDSIGFYRGEIIRVLIRKLYPHHEAGQSGRRVSTDCTSAYVASTVITIMGQRLRAHCGTAARTGVRLYG